MTKLSEIEAQALRIIQTVHRLRVAEREVDRPVDGLRGTVIDFSRPTDGPVYGRGEPKEGAKASKAFADGTRFWAEAVAPAVTYVEWDTIVWNVAKAVPEFDGDVIRFFETRFEALKLKCGALIAP